MKLHRLEIQNLRVLRTLAIHPSPSLNLFVGPNGSGKTSLLEGIYVLGLGRSFRTRHIKEAVARGSKGLVAFGELSLEDGRTVFIGVERQGGGSRIRIDGRDIHTASELARTMPVFMITPHGQWLLAEGAQQRRKLIDWTLFHVEPVYLAVLQRYHRVLRQRNAQLKQASVAQLPPWNRQVGQLGEAVHAYRKQYLDALTPSFHKILGAFLPVSVELAYEPGWDVRKTLHEALAETTKEAKARGYTGVGPHRADLEFRVGGTPAQRVLSRGEGKLLILGFLLAQVDCVIQSVAKTPIVLVDDFPAELDMESRTRFMRSLAEREVQTFFTSLSDATIDTSYWQDAKRFHVKQGQVQECTV
jgi:DNA replication and repair protein RecF